MYVYHMLWLIHEFEKIYSTAVFVTWKIRTAFTEFSLVRDEKVVYSLVQLLSTKI